MASSDPSLAASRLSGQAQQGHGQYGQQGPSLHQQQQGGGAAPDHHHHNHNHNHHYHGLHGGGSGGAYAQAQAQAAVGGAEGIMTAGGAALAGAGPGGQQQHRQQQLTYDQQEQHPQHPQQQRSEGAAGPSKPIRRRMRMITSCLECRRRKLKCNKTAPCTNCVKFARDCLYLGPKLDEASQLRLTEIKEKVGSLERQLERDVAKSAARGFQQQRILADDVGDGLDEEGGLLEITPMVALDLTYEGDADDSKGDIIDLGIQVGKMRITERIGGLNRPRISEEIQAGIAGASGSRPGHRGPPPGFGPPPGPPAGADFSSDGQGPEAIPDFLRPGASYIPPTSGFFFGQVINSPSLLNFLPRREAGDLLMRRYFEAVHPIARCLHWPSFELEYAAFWDDIEHNYEPRASIQAVVFAAWFTAVVSLDEAAVNRDFGYIKANLMEHMKIGTEAALSKANFLRTTKVETMQAFVMYMVPLCRAEVSRAHSVLVGAAVRMAECMGLHRDGEAYGLTPLETHVRRLIWHQLCFLDIRTCEAQGPKPAIRRDDYDTKLPINCDEEELTQAVAPPEPAECWTSTLLPLMRFEINEMMRIIWVDRRKLENHRTTLTAVLTKIENFRKRMFDKYDGFLDDDVPVQKYAKLVMHLLMYRLHCMVLHPYHSNAASPMPPRLNAVLIMAGIMIIEISIQLETSPPFAGRWGWYAGAYQQYHIALLLATEIYYRPASKEADRIWPCLDYTFGMDRATGREEKGLKILTEIMSKTAVYMGMRKMRAPTGIARAVPASDAVKPEATPSPPPAAPLNMAMSAGTGGVYPPQQQQLPPMPLSAVKADPGMQQQQQPRAGMMNLRQQQQMGGPMPPPMMPPPGAPPPNIVFAGVSNGEVLWSLPPNPNPNADSPESSEGGTSVAGRLAAGGGGMGGAAAPSYLDNFDWDAFNTLFPHDPQTGELSMTGFTDPSIGMKWH